MKNMKVYNSVLELIGNTPLIKLNKMPSENMAEIYAKLESYNPGGSVKDRIALSMIQAAEKKGLLKKGYIVIEPTSGNTGIGIAMICAVKKYKCILTMPESMSLERIYTLKSFGAEVILTPSHKGIEGAIEKAEELKKKIKKSVILRQFENPANPQIHRETTAKEILKILGKKINAFVAGVGTGGTITGVGEILKQKIKDLKIYAVEPEGSAVLSGGKPGPHKIQGIGPGFIPSILNTRIIDEVIKVSDDEAYIYSKRLANEEGLFVGISSGAAMCAALKIAKKIGKNKKIVVIFPDGGDRYFSLEQYYKL